MNGRKVSLHSCCCSAIGCCTSKRLPALAHSDARSLQQAQLKTMSSKMERRDMMSVVIGSLFAGLSLAELQCDIQKNSCLAQSCRYNVFVMK